MNTYYCALVFAITVIYSLKYLRADKIYTDEGIDRIIFLQHTKSKKYVSQFNGTSGSHATLTVFPQFAQSFRLEKTDEGALLFVTEDRDAVLDKTKGCDLGITDVGYYTTISGLKNQQFTINNIGSIGSKCCETCLIVPNNDYTRLVVNNYSCLYESQDDWKFTIFPTQEVLNENNKTKQ